ncbi:MAG: NAD(+) synthase [Nannocystaceae bacterium]
MPVRAALSPALEGVLQALRRRRRFDPDRALDAKVALLRAYFARSGLRAAVVGVSGGVDSAVTLGLLRRVAEAEGAAPLRVVAALVPIFADDGATHQDVALARGREVARALGAEAIVADLSEGHRVIKAAVDVSLDRSGRPWSSGQLVSYLRTPALYYLTALLGEGGEPAVLCGTTNRDEGAYLGFFGKASDGMVDLQPISDLHKSEVYALAGRLGVPRAVIEATPTGDTYDGRADVEMIGAPYDFVELYTGLRALGEGASRRLTAGLGAAAREEFAAMAAAVEGLHRVNLHKYLGGASAIHFDVWPREVPGGWERPAPREPARARPLAEFHLDRALVEAIAGAEPPPPVGEAIADFGASAVLLRGVLGVDECARLRSIVDAAEKVPASRHGRAEGFDPASDPIGTWRCSTFDDGLAAALWRRIAAALPPVRVMDPWTPTDHGGAPVWRPIGLNPLLRMMVAEPGGLTLPHTDSTFDLGDGERRTLMSVLVVLGAEGVGGATQLLHEPRRHLPVEARDLDDRSEPAAEHEVLARVDPEVGSALLFDHRIPHEGARWGGPGRRVLLRSDVIFTRCGPPLDALPPARPVDGALWGRLGVAPGSDDAAIDRAYLGRRDHADAEARAALRFAWGLLRDPYYRGAYARVGAAATTREAGYFDDGREPDDPVDPRDDLRWLVTPLHRAIARLATLQRREAAGEAPRALAVLVSTGAFCPIHEGHLAMMERARSAIEARGGEVLAGYLSVSHDRYVLAKCGAEAPAAAERLRLCEAAIAGSEWLMVDPWEALHCDRARNFTDVVGRLEALMNAHLRAHRRVEVVYVFGSDNADFALAFAERGGCVCVPRPGSLARLEALRGEPALRRRSSVILDLDVDAAIDRASARIRGGDEVGLPAAIRGPWRALIGARERPRRPRIFVRDEGAWAIEPWLGRGDDEALLAARGRFLAGALEALAGAFVGGPAPAIEVLELEAQRREVAVLRRRARVVSLDPCVPGDADLAISRCFELACDAVREDMVERPWSLGLVEQLGAIPPGDYLLVDDDQVSGRTVAAARALLADRCRVIDVHALCAPAERAAADEVSELCDARDLLPGAREAGLVIALPNGALARAPYLLPYVRPAARLKIPVAREIAFSAEIWGLAAELFAAITPALTVADTAPAFRALAELVGFAPTTTMAALCRWHVERLRGPGV